ncbi:MAG: 1-deoxy-D-xylulose-5-phosphate reductoisomerase [Gracilimonas sp.]|uniref:1-deoxy-D-xylulose-5-phosphate reductoisomerase n=1 Tax=Gracilimonas sp. TaxID=1974203 RepID=UPI00198D51B1|nr:1-deoxy-D-xylulose-5-phosphate reductoisomerase [Gracilimonas sp.]MBD3615793.1 1-deoxy-D-xylulose-5-phosphate reductoisomerase [Gracilimonas sp.]
MKKQKLAILGSTGSIGTQALDIVRQHSDKFEIVALTANSNWELLAEQVKEFSPSYTLIGNEGHFETLKNTINHTEVISGSDKLPEIASLEEVDTVLNALVGFAGFESTVAAIRAGKKVALANKESLVVGGALITEELKKSKTELIPVDSEHSAMLQCLVGESMSNIEKIIITASGGPFREFSLKQMEEVTVAEALNHPNWNMGAKITIDSSTMMNKGLEIIEAYWLFDIPVEKIEPVIHPQSIIHSMITFIDGSSKAQLGLPDMKVPIIYALGYPERLPLETARIDWNKIQNLTFEPVDFKRFPCVKLAMDSIKLGGYAPAVLNAANEVAVERFLNKEIGYIYIAEVVEKSLAKIESSDSLNIETLKEIDKETRTYAASILK